MINVYHQTQYVLYTCKNKLTKSFVIDPQVTIIYRQDTLEFNVDSNTRLSLFMLNFTYSDICKYKAIKKCYAPFFSFNIYMHVALYIYIFFSFYITLYIYMCNVHILNHYIHTCKSILKLL